MPQTFPKIEKHQDFEEIDTLIQNGESPVEISKMLVNRYPGDKTKHISYTYLYTYRRTKYPLLAKLKKAQRYEYRSTKQLGIETGPDANIDISRRIMILTGQEPKPPAPLKDISNEELLGWVGSTDGFVKFTEDMIIERGQPVKLQDYQVEMSDKFINHTRVCINGAGQIGKDFMLQNFIIWWCLTHAGSLQLVVCATQSQSVALMNRIIGKIKASGDLLGAYATKGMKPEPKIVFNNEAQCLFLTAKSTIAGHTDVDLIYVNEARDIRPEEVSRVSPLLGIGGGKLIVLSRPRFRRGYFWDCYSSPAFETMRIPTIRNKFFNKKAYEDDKATLSPDLFKIEYLAEFADAGSSYFSETAIDNCSKVDYEFKAMVPEPKYEYSLGIDPARLRDTAAMIVTGQHIETKKKKVVHIHGFSPDRADVADFSHQHAYVRLLHSRFNFKYIVPEFVGMGIPYSERLKEEWGESPSLIQPYQNASLRDKIALYEECKNVIETLNVQIPRSAFQLINELKMTQFGATDMGKVRIETPVTDDYADALALSLWAFKKPFEIGFGAVRREVRRPTLLTR